MLAAAFAFYLLFIFRTSFRVGQARYFVLFEDAMISMRYARHLAEGHGLVWNIGELPIEGFTNLLWVLWMAVAHKLGMSESKISLFVMLSGIAILMGLGIVTAKIARKITQAPWVPVAVLAATLFDYPLVFWTLRGMEVGALALFIYSLLWLVLENEDEFQISRTVAMGVLAAGALLIRSDSAVPVGILCLYGFFTCSRRWLFALILGAFGCAAVGSQMVFRRAYFHESLPNTYFLKLYKISALARIKRGAFVALEVLALHLAVPISVGLAAMGRLRRDFYRDQPTRRMVLLGTLFCAQVGYATYVGGDAWEWMLYANRYMCVGMPALIVLVAALLSNVVREENLFDVGERFARRLSLGLGISGLVLLALNGLAAIFPEQGVARTIVFSKVGAAVGAALVVVGVLFRLRDLREGMAEALIALRRRLESRHTVLRFALVLAALVWAPSHLIPVGRWIVQNAAQYKDEANYARLGLLIREATPPQTRIAVAAAGATPYFAHRATEDLLGKNDRVIAKLAPRGVFSPGHDKWDYRYSLGQRHSDLIVETVDVNAADEDYIASLGFETLPNNMRLRTTSGVTRKDVLGREMSDGATLNAALFEIGKVLPPSLLGADVAAFLGFGFLFAFVFTKAGKDSESLDGLSPEEPSKLGTAAPLDASAKAAIAGADAGSIPTLDGMRGIAVLLVLTFHFAWTFPGDDPNAATTFAQKCAVRVHDLLWTGWVGVDLFFVLSGYLITRGLVSNSEKPLGARLKMFWMRRVLRIFPLYYAFVVVGSIAALSVSGGDAWVPGLSYWAYMQNYALAFDDEVLRWTAHFWSLAIEEQFYFVWPIVALVVSRRRLIPTIVALIAFVIALRAWFIFQGMSVSALREQLHNEHGIAKFVYRATFTRADGLLLGAFVAVTQREVFHPVSKIWRRLRLPILVGTSLALAGLYALAGGLNDYDRRVMAIGYGMLALFFASAISMCSDAVIGDRVRRFLLWRPLVACGKVSYGMYIFHWVLVVFLVPHLLRLQATMSIGAQMALCFGVIVGGIAVVYGLASASFRWFETPFLNLKRRFHD